MESRTMGKVTFEGRVKKHLALYKRDVLQVLEDGIWPGNGKPYPHILPKKYGKLNILPAFRYEFWTWLDPEHIRLHRFFHHLNSSQALCFNLFFPFLNREGEKLEAIVQALGFAEELASGACFEFEPDPSEGTNFDFIIPLSSGRRILFEVKYTESGFGAARDDEEHRTKFQDTYRLRTAERFEAPFCSQASFLRNYQILRNLWHLDLEKEDTAVFLIPRANESLRRAEAIIRSCLLPPLRERAKIVYLEDLLSRLGASSEVSGSYKKGALAEFKAKYFPA